MPAAFTVELTGDRELLLKVDHMPTRLRQALVRTTMALASVLERKVRAEHLSGPTGEHTLSVVTGNLRASVHQLPVLDTPTLVQGGVGYGASVAYAAIHEFGGIIQVPAMMVLGKTAMHFYVGADEVFTKRTRAHTVKMPARAPLRTSLDEMRQQIIDAYKQAGAEAIHE